MAYYIIYPRGDKSKLSVLHLNSHMEHEINDYSRASKQEFTTKAAAMEYAELLAYKHGKTLDKDNDFLD